MVYWYGAIGYIALAAVVAYVFFSVQSALWVLYRRGKYIHLEFEPRRAKGTSEPRRIVQLRRMRLIAVCGVLVLIADSIAQMLFPG
ncbi:MAG: hypothetical protein ACRYG5_18625 [Janthinobacterium lividum]